VRSIKIKTTKLARSITKSYTLLKWFVAVEWQNKGTLYKQDLQSRKP